jgi:hypothetical protein
MNLISLYRDNQRIRARAVARFVALALLGAALAFGGFVVLALVI